MKTQTQLQLKKNQVAQSITLKKQTEGLSACLRYQQLPFINFNWAALVIPGDAEMMKPSVRLEQRWIPGTYLNSPLIIDNISLDPIQARSNHTGGK